MNTLTGQKVVDTIEESPLQRKRENGRTVSYSEKIWQKLSIIRY